MATRSSKRRLSYDSNDDSQPGESVSQVCTLCELVHQHTSKVQTWQSPSARDEAFKLGIIPSDVICRPCRDDIRRIGSDSNHVPRWEKKRQELTKCSIHGCGDVCFAKLQVTNVKEHLEKMHFDVKFKENVPFPTPLCISHYHIVYHAIRPRQRSCQTCGANLRHETSRPCPNAAFIKKHLQDNAAFEGNLEVDDRVCFSCYKSHLIILQNEKQNSYDSDLRSLLENISRKITATNSPSTLLQVRELALDKTVLYVGEELLNGMAVILPDAVDYFQQACNDNSLDSQHQLGAEPKVSSIWLLGNLTNALQQHLEYSCAARKYGVLMYRSGVNLAPLLQRSLYQLRQHKKKDPTNVEFQKVLDGINNKILEQCQHFLTKYHSFCEDYSTIDINEVINHDINPELWNAVCSMTRSASERKGIANKQAERLGDIWSTQMLKLLEILFVNAIQH